MPTFKPAMPCYSKKRMNYEINDNYRPNDILVPGLWRLAGAGGILLLAGMASAHAAGFALKEQSAVAQGTSFAGATARADDPSTLFFNPAGMAKLPGYQVSLNAAWIAPSSVLSNGSASRAPLFGGGPIGGETGGDAASATVLPAGYVSVPLSPDWHAGLSITAPFGLTTKYAPNSLARYYALTTSLTTVDVSPAVSWQATPHLALGAALLVEYARANLSNAVDFGSLGAAAGLAGLGLLPGRADGNASFHGDDTALGWQLGALYEPAAGTRVGIDYRSAIVHRLTGNASFQRVPAPLTPFFAGGAAIAKLPEPAMLSAGVTQAIGAWTLLADVIWTEWSTFRNLLVTYPGGRSQTVETWRDAWGISLGAEVRLNESITLRAGTAFDQTPTRTATRTPRIADGDRYWLSLGATWQPQPHLALSAAYSHIFVDAGDVALTDAGPATPNFARGNLAARFGNAIDIGALQATLAF